MKSAAQCGGGAKAQIQSQTAGSNYSANPPSPQALCRRLDVICAEVVANLRQQRQAEHLHRLGPRPMLEALAEVEVGRPLDTVLAEYGRLDPDFVNAPGGGDFPPRPLHEVRP